MDINEEYEELNKVHKMHIVHPVLYVSSFDYEYSIWALSLEKINSQWREEKVQMPNLTRSWLLGRLGKDILLNVLCRLDIRSLIRCMSVEMSLKKLIQSSELRRMSAGANKQFVVLVTSYTLPCKLWVPGSSSGAATLFRPLTGLGEVAGAATENVQVVASDRGLVCIRFKDDTSRALCLAVGNPVTQEWVAVPKSFVFSSMFCSHRFTMEVGESHVNVDTVDFKVAVFATSPQEHIYYVFDSTTGYWSGTMLSFPPRCAFKWSAFDLRSSCWTTELIRKWDIKTGLERSPTEVHRLSHPILHGFCKWEYKRSSFFATSWSVQQPIREGDRDGKFAGYGVWKVMDDGALETVAAVWGRELASSLEAIRENMIAGCPYSVSCTASANLVCFGGDSWCAPNMPVVVYDIETKEWTVFDEKCPSPDSDDSDDDFQMGHDSGDHYAAAVVYSPSLLAPSIPPKRNRKSAQLL